eukprot:TRINITY_DN3014_c0_g1_i1.p1 TRINITY_DN3014_c0_g1~~TRINITY_DN3014_c0_g1_i1.p1  ORF type:complete len:388 (+),score=55.68 TRINITY_DN3014_c0_g1_i1:74-1237(+)
MCSTLKRFFTCANIDTVLAYSTVKIVTIRDYRLGLIHYLFMIAILAYVFGFTIIYEKRYLLREAPTGSVRISVQSPQTQKKVMPPPEDIPYCQIPGRNTYRNLPIYTCEYWNEDLAVFPVLEQSSLFASTRVTVLEKDLQPAGCNLTDPNCTYAVGSSRIVYVAGIENFTVLIDHSMYCTQIDIQANSLGLPGELIGYNGPLPAGNQVGQEGKYDILNLGTIIQAAGVDLDAQGIESQSNRYDGIVLLFFIEYSNTYTFNTGNIRYQYKVRAVENAEFKSMQPIYTKNVNAVNVYNRHGPRIIFLQTGQLGVFDFPTLLLSFVSGLGLLTISTLIVDLVVLRIMPKTRHLYSQYKYVETPHYNNGKSEYEDINDPEFGREEIVNIKH